MTKRITAIFDGQTLRPDSPEDTHHLTPNTRYSVTIEALPNPPERKEGDMWDLLDSLAGSVSAPSDWSVEHDHYLYGTPKREPDRAG